MKDNHGFYQALKSSDSVLPVFIFDRNILNELQDEEDGSQSVLVAGDTAIVTAKLFIKGTANGEKIDRTLWFSDTYVRTPSGWLYLFGQASLPLQAAQQ